MLKRVVHIWKCILLKRSAWAPYVIYWLCSKFSCQDQRDQETLSQKKIAQKMSFTLDCGFTHAAIMNCISDSKGNALPYGVRHKIYLNFSGTYKKNIHSQRWNYSLKLTKNLITNIYKSSQFRKDGNTSNILDRKIGVGYRSSKSRSIVAKVMQASNCCI